jgi:hypothetical protein
VRGGPQRRDGIGPAPSRIGAIAAARPSVQFGEERYSPRNILQQQSGIVLTIPAAAIVAFVTYFLLRAVA